MGAKLVKVLDEKSGKHTSYVNARCLFESVTFAFLMVASEAGMAQFQ